MKAAQSQEAVKDRVLAIAHEEDVSEWGAAIVRSLEQHSQSVPLLQLQRSLLMPLVQLWLGLLHELRASEVVCLNVGDYQDDELVIREAKANSVEEVPVIPTMLPEFDGYLKWLGSTFRSSS